MTAKNNSGRTGKQQAFRQKAQAQARKEAIPKTKILPNVLWESTDVLAIDGATLEGLNKTIELLYHGFQQLGQIYQNIVARNVESPNNPEGKIRVKYMWDNGEEVSEQELKKFQAKMAEIQALRARQEQEVKQTAAIQEKEPSSGLVTAEGAPLTQESLEERSKIIS